MGYRSEVAVVIYGDDRDPKKYELLKTLMNTTFKDVYTEFEGRAQWHDSKSVLEFHMYDIKWYESYPDVIEFTTMLAELVGIEGFNYELMRVGEDANDIDEQYGGKNCERILNVTRTIEVDL